jgi:hypothetical protein
VERARLTPTDDGAGILIFRTLLAAFFVIGCSSQTTSLPYPLTISEEGLGAIHPDTPFNQIPTLMIGFETEKLSAVSSSDQVMIYQIKRGGDLLAQVISDSSGKKVASIHILSSLIQDRYNQTLGQPLQKKPFICHDNQCADPAAPNILYTIEPNQRTILEITYQTI